MVHGLAVATCANETMLLFFSPQIQIRIIILICFIWIYIPQMFGWNEMPKLKLRELIILLWIHFYREKEKLHCQQKWEKFRKVSTKDSEFEIVWMVIVLHMNQLPEREREKMELGKGQKEREGISRHGQLCSN